MFVPEREREMRSANHHLGFARLQRQQQPAAAQLAPSTWPSPAQSSPAQLAQVDRRAAEREQDIPE